MPIYNETYTGTFVDLACLSVEDVHIIDIAHHLSCTGRANGGFTEFYSVAEHSTLVARMMRTHGADPRMQLAGLLHDGHETYLGDITRPVAKWIAALVGTEVIAQAKGMLDGVIAKKFNLTLDELCGPGVKHWDNLALAIESYWMLPSRGVGPHWEGLPKPTEQQLKRYRPLCQPPRVAEQHFYSTFNNIIAQGLENGNSWGNV